MAFDWETYRIEICDLYCVQGIPLNQVISLMKEKYGFSACERTYRSKITDWGAQKHAPTRQAQRVPRQSIDSGYHSQSFRSPSTRSSQYSQSVEDSSSIFRPVTPSTQQLHPTRLSSSTEHLTASPSISGSRISGYWSPGSSQADDASVDTALTLPVSEPPCRGRHFRNACHSGKETSSNRRELRPVHPPSSSSNLCAGFSHLSSLGFCPPHALPSACLAAHTETRLFDPSLDPLSCGYCNATKLHCLASLAPKTNISDFEQELRACRHLLGGYDNNGNSCVHFAAGSGASLAHLVALAREGAPMKHVNNDGQTFLHVLNTKLYSPDTLAPIIGWALYKTGGMTQRDFLQRTVWHSIFQRGLNSDVFRRILPYLESNKDDMMMPDIDNHTPLDCLRSYWTLTEEIAALDYLNVLQAAGILPLGYAVNRTLPLDNIPEEAKTNSAQLSSSARPPVPAPTGQVRSYSTKTISRGLGTSNPRNHGVGGIISSYRHGLPLDCNASMSSTDFYLDNGWPLGLSPVPEQTLPKARRVLGL